MEKKWFEEDEYRRVNRKCSTAQNDSVSDSLLISPFISRPRYHHIVHSSPTRLTSYNAVIITLFASAPVQTTDLHHDPIVYILEGDSGKLLQT